MKVNVHAVNFDTKLVGYVQERMDKLEITTMVSSDVYLKVEKTSDKENKVVEIKINVPGDDFMVKNNVKRLKRQLS
jgi:putative sigma-54 modulation protein